MDFNIGQVFSIILSMLKTGDLYEIEFSFLLLKHSDVLLSNYQGMQPLPVLYDLAHYQIKIINIAH